MSVLAVRADGDAKSDVRVYGEFNLLAALARTSHFV